MRNRFKACLKDKEKNQQLLNSIFFQMEEEVDSGSVPSALWMVPPKTGTGNLPGACTPLSLKSDLRGPEPGIQLGSPFSN